MIRLNPIYPLKRIRTKLNLFGENSNDCRASTSGIQADQQNIVAVQFDGLTIGKADCLARPQIFAALGSMQAELGEIEMDGWVKDDRLQC